MKQILSLLILSIFISFSCKKEPSKESQTNNNMCYITNWEESNVSINYAYDANDRIITENITKGSGAYVLPAKRTFNYKSDRITVNELPSNTTYDLLLSSNRVVEFSFPSAWNDYSKVEYSSDGYVTKISNYYKTDNKLYHTKEFKYQNGNLISVIATGGIGTPNQYTETYSLEYYQDRKAIEGVDFALNKFIMPDWYLSDYFTPFQLPVSFFGGGSGNLLKAVRFPHGGEYFSFTYDFDKNDKVTKITYIDKRNAVKIVNLSFNCK
ncbi:DUF4595 domain-containing protein [Pedobacter sp. N36a]|uniref:DUF4595 domain-containing protein n=1 Tax=Pedobacter sp. N36a TaxID=2767996 RepID=UPI0016569157|nr:DUF4595 domain-containing protein [Pedobacter sp. N36a]MBC8987558.1 DUF4595 domain-containing protein [Pedobacter sp. N36a]